MSPLDRLVALGWPRGMTFVVWRKIGSRTLYEIPVAALTHTDVDRIISDTQAVRAGEDNS